MHGTPSLQGMSVRDASHMEDERLARQQTREAEIARMEAMMNDADEDRQNAADNADRLDEVTSVSFFRDQFTPPGFISSNSAFQGAPVVAASLRTHLASRSRVHLQSDGTWCSCCCCSS